MGRVSLVPVLILALGSASAFAANETEAPAEVHPVSARTGRSVLEERIEVGLPGRKIKRQIITIPPSVTKVKLVQPPLNPRQHYRKFRRPIKKAYVDHEAQFEDPFHFDAQKVKRNLKKPLVKEVSPQEFYQDEEPGTDDGHRHRSVHRVVKIKRKRPKTGLLGEEAAPVYGRDPSPAKQVQPSNLFPFKMEPLDESYIPGMVVKKLPSKSRQIQSLFSQQYTSHNPHVLTNFGPTGFQAHFNQPAAAASEQVATSLPVHAPGIQVIQPPQFSRDAASDRPPRPSRLTGASSPQKEEPSGQRATIRDILEQDCPSYEAKGYCESPPRYPMQQIGSMVKKCANLMDAMNTQPFEEPLEVYDFAKRSDRKPEGDDPANGTSPWSRSSDDGLTACSSELALAEPGYAREVSSGRWFVIVQHPDTTIQRIATDACAHPGKPCTGLSGLKCTKVNGFPHKSSRCVQRFTHQRLISWDPEHPEGCPRMRVFRFPSACVCHLPG